MMSRFGELSPRMHGFREDLLNARPRICTERALLTTESYKLHADKPVVLKRAYMLKNVLENMSIYIEDQTLLAGNQASGNRFAPIFPEYAMDWVIKELDTFENGTAMYSSSAAKQKSSSAPSLPFGHTIPPRTRAWQPCRPKAGYTMTWAS